MGAPRLLQRVEIGAEIDPVRRNGVLKAVPREQYDTRVTAPETANAQGARRAAVRCARRKFSAVKKAGLSKPVPPITPISLLIYSVLIFR